MASVKPPDRSAAEYKLEEVRRLVSDCMLGDCVVRIEHTDHCPRQGTRWREWGSPLFALRDAGPVLDAIGDCHARHPGQAIRLIVEKLHPESRMVYWVLHADERQARPHDDASRPRQPPSHPELPLR